MAGIASKTLTVAFHEYGFISKLNRENQVGPWYTRSDQERQQLSSPWGLQNPHALNRYSSVLNAPTRWTDPSGHTWYLGHEETNDLILLLSDLKADVGGLGTVLGAIGGGGNAGAIVAAIAEKLGITSSIPILVVPLLLGWWLHI